MVEVGLFDKAILSLEWTVEDPSGMGILTLELKDEQGNQRFYEDALADWEFDRLFNWDVSPARINLGTGKYSVKVSVSESNGALKGRELATTGWLADALIVR